MTKRDDESIASTIRREQSLSQAKQKLINAIENVSKYRSLTDVEAAILFIYTYYELGVSRKELLK